MNLLTIAVTVLFAAVLGLMIVVWALSRQIGILFERVSPLGALVTDAGPEVGAAAPTFELASIISGRLEKIGGRTGHSTLLFFLSPTCPVCKKLLPVLRHIEADERGWLRLVLASDGDADEHRRYAQAQRLTGYPYLLSAELGMAFRVSRLPFAVLIGEDGRVQAKGLVNNREQIESLFNAKELGVSSVQQYLERTHPSV